MDAATASRSDEVKNELRRLAKEGGGRLSPADLVEAARPKGSVLHSLFEWDDGAAADLYRLDQARRIIRYQVTWVEVEDKRIPVRAFHSVPSSRPSSILGDDEDEEEPARSYVLVNHAMNDKSMREELLSEAKADARRFVNKYSVLRELADVLAAMRKVI